MRPVTKIKEAKSMIEIKNRYTGEVILTVDADTLVGVNLSGKDLRYSDLRGSNLDFACMPLWCGDLKAGYDDKQIIQQLYHVLSHVKYSHNASDDLKSKMLTDELIELANRFHRANECGKL